MDSGNSGSLQSSSGGDEEYDSRAESRAESISAFLNQTTRIAPMSNPPPPQPPSPPPHHHQPNSTMFDPLPNNYFDQLTNFDPVWSKTDPTYGSLFAASSPTVPFPPVSTVSDKTNDLVRTPGVRNPKKRSRASRRAPTTVLTTDTTNFRAMVQEFTGIPAPPFPSSSSSSPFTRNRLDLFGTPSSTRSYLLGDSSSHNPPPPPPPYLLRPFAQKFQPPPFLSPNSNSSGPNSNSAINYQMQNQILTFQSLLQNPLANSSFLRSSESLEIPSSDSGRAVDEFGSSRDDNQTSWAGGVGVGSNGDPLRSVNGDYVDYSGSNLSIGKLNYEKGSENVVGGRGEGMVETWISSSDH